MISMSAAAGVTLVQACSDNAANNQPSPGNRPVVPVEDNTPKPAALDPSDRRGTLIGPGARREPSGEMEYWLRFADLDNIEAYVNKDTQPPSAAMTFFGHAVVPHPVQKQRAAVFAKWGTGGCEIDMRQRAVTREIIHTPGREFYGHAAWSKDGKLLYAVESEPRSTGTYDGYVVVRDADDMRVLGEFPTYGKSPHDCHILDDGRTLAITNGGGVRGDTSPGCVTFVDIESEKLLESVNIPDLMAGHVAIGGASSKGAIAVGSTAHSPPGTGPEGFRTVPGGLTLRAAGAVAATTVNTPADVVAKMLGETLSLTIHDELGIVGCTNPDGNLVSFWDIKQAKFLKSFDFREACGIALTLDKRYFVATARYQYAVRLIRARDLELVEGASFSLSGINGSHCIIYDL